MNFLRKLYYFTRAITCVWFDEWPDGDYREDWK